MGESVSFDRAAGYYDATRSLSPEAAEAQTRVLAGELRGQGRCLEIGVGTGRIALPLHEAGIPITGIDLSAEMLRVLVRKAAGMPFPVAVGDATRMPFADGSFGATLVCHVLHLVSDRRRTIAELRRVVRPGGTVLLDLGGFGASGSPLEWWREARRVFAEAAGIPKRPEGPEIREEVDAILREFGAEARPLEPIHETRTTIPEQRIAHLEEGLYSFTWDADEVARRRGGAALREWAGERMGSLTEPVTMRREIQWLAYDLDA